jgi:hypothetical protein
MGGLGAGNTVSVARFNLNFSPSNDAEFLNPEKTI